MHRLLSLLLCIGLCLTVVPAQAEEGPAVSLLPEGEAHLDTWTHPFALGSQTLPPIMLTLPFPAEPEFRLETPAIDDVGMLWHFRVAQPDLWGEIRFVQTPRGLELDPMTLFLASTLFPEDAIALAQSEDLLEVEAPVEIEGRMYRGCFRAERRADVVAVGAYALAEPVDPDTRATAWAALRGMLPEAKTAEADAVAAPAEAVAEAPEPEND